MPPVLAALLSALVLALPTGAAPPDIDVVRTWGDLRRQPVLRTPHGPKVRVGLSSYTGSMTTPPQLWVLAHGKHGRIGFAVDGDRVGPLTLVARPDLPAPVDRIKRLAECILVERMPAANKRLYAALLRVRRPGTHRVAVRDHKGRVLAKTTVEILERHEPDWMPLSWPRHKKQALQKARPAGTPVDVRLAPLELPALPRSNGWTPIAHGGKGQPDARALARLLPEKRDPRLRVIVRGRTLDVRIKGGFHYTHVRRQVLARWWIDGVPKRLDAGRKRMDHAKKMSFAGRRVSRMKISLVQLARFGIRPDSRVEVQLLICPDGWRRSARWGESDRQQKEVALPAKMTDRAPMMTQRLLLQPGAKTRP